MVSLISPGILLVLTAAGGAQDQLPTEGSQDQLFDVNVIFKAKSNRLLEISFDRKHPFSVLDQFEAFVILYECYLQKNGKDNLSKMDQTPSPLSLSPCIMIPVNQSRSFQSDVKLNCLKQLKV